ncbi:NADP-dependent oxidoreductase domain-containing protein [Mycena metata]|uniref:NADP-dependent oxidoreductase domain-containing protein n=1 Tax=Mycena metata TaxID=1033252 RepID=A0AAD7J0J8_9AGAR|nr:NADP-dependent oxidoreductase domain-containing protein [Mycena metata]
MFTPISNVGVVFGAMTVGEPGNGPGRHFLTVTTHEASIKLLDIFQRHGHSEVDTARIYGGGSSEEHLGAIGWQQRGLKIDTKLYPTRGKNMSYIYADEVTHSPADLRKGLKESLTALKTNKINIFYLHVPDRATPFEDTLREVNKIYDDGVFERFGLSNFQSWEVAQVCKHNGWVMPTVYQGALYAFNPLAAGFLTSAYTRDKAEFDTGDRFDPSQPVGKYLRTRYWHEPNFKALDLLRPEIAKHGITESEAAFRWLAHHSVLKKELGDAVILGASSPKHLEENLAALDKGPLPDEVVAALEAGWEHTRVSSLKYWS